MKNDKKSFVLNIPFPLLREIDPLCLVTLAYLERKKAQRPRRKDGFFRVTMKEVEDDLGMYPATQMRVMRALRTAGLVEWKSMMDKEHFRARWLRIDFDRLKAKCSGVKNGEQTRR